MRLKNYATALVLFLICPQTAYLQVAWTQKTNLGGVGRQNAVAFSIGNRGYIGTGYSSAPPYYLNDFWQYNPETDSWTQKASLGGVGRSGAVGFSIGGKGYIGTGYQNLSLSDFWEYDTTSNAWNRKADFPGGGRWSAVGFSIAGKGYIGTGIDSTLARTKDFWEYDTSSNTWTRKQDFGGTARNGATSFSIGTKGYIGTGIEVPGGFRRNDFWEYNPSTNAWINRASLPAPGRLGAVGFSIASRGYIGAGYVGSPTEPVWKDFWEYDQSSNTWTEKALFPGQERWRATAFAVGQLAYFGTGFEYSGFTHLRDIWEFDPTGDPVPPSQVNLRFPDNLQTVRVDSTVRKVLFIWYPAYSTTLTYGLEISTNSGFTNIVFADTSITPTSYLAQVPEGNATYWWRVRAKNSAGWGPYSMSRSFNAIFDNLSNIDLLIVYTPAAEAWADSFAGGINLVLAQAILRSQLVVDNSHVNTNIRLAHSAVVNYTESGNHSTDLSRLSRPDDGYMDEVFALANAHQADLISLVVRHLGGGVAGAAYLRINLGVGYNFSVGTAGAYSHVLIHELGHNFGMEHSRNQINNPAPPSGGLFEYSTGWRWTGIDSIIYVSVMTYLETPGVQVPIFSNPDILWAGTPTGSYDFSNPYAPADNARTLREIQYIVASSSSEVVSVPPDETILPSRFVLYQSFPNPFNPSTAIRYNIPLSGVVSLKIYNILGQEIATLVNEWKQVGTYSTTWDASGLPSGVYFYRLQLSSFNETKKLILLR